MTSWVKHGGREEVPELPSSRPVVSCRTGRHRLGITGLQGKCPERREFGGAMSPVTVSHSQKQRDGGRGLPC